MLPLSPSSHLPVLVAPHLCTRFLISSPSLSSLSPSRSPFHPLRSVYTVGINRVGTEAFPNEYTSGDGKPAHKEFGHFYGSSYVAGPTGQRTPPLSRTRAGLLVAEVDLNLLRQVRNHWNFHMCARWDDYVKMYTEQAKVDFKPPVVRDPLLDSAAKGAK